MPIYIQRMQSQLKLSTADREFFALVTRAAFSNPFTDERAELDRRIAGMEGEDPAQLMAAVNRAVSRHVEALEQGAGADLRAYPAEDQQVLRYALLFDVFHRFADAFDEYIRKDLATGDGTPPVPFARDALNLLSARGFSAAVACGYFAMFYQLRRAYFFIDQSMMGRTPVMKEFRRRLWNNVFTHETQWYERHLWNRMEDFSTLMLGETGTGKGAAAAAIGKSCFIPFDENKLRFARSIARTFVSINLSQFPESLIESELFGHRKGAFTGAVDHYDGVLSRCCPHGVIFLDEIGELSPAIQIKLLQVLQERTYAPVGSHESKRFPGRVIAATNRTPEELRREGRMRADFYYRLCSDIITAPTLRERIQEDPAELDLLASHILQRQLGTTAPDVLDEVRASLERAPGPDYPWPGNVRELGQAVRRILLTGEYRGEVTDVDGHGTDEELIMHALRHGTLTANDLQAKYCALLHARFGTYGEVARRTGLDWRTVKKYVERTKG